MSKISITGIQARDKAIKGMSFIAKSVKESIGPFGLNHLSEKGNKISNDGAFIANELLPTIKDEFERRGATVVNANINAINDEIGDASSTSWALHEAISKEVLRYLPTETTIKAKKTCAEIGKMLDTACKDVISKLDPKPVLSESELIKSALVSVEDEKVAEMLGSMQWHLGSEGRIIAEESNQSHCSIEKVNGIMLDNGFVSSSWISNPEKQSLEILSPVPIVLTNYTIGVAELAMFRESIFKTLASQQKKGCVLMARAFTSDAIKEVTEGKNEFAVILINAPYTNQKEAMKDIEAVVGGRYIDTEEATLADVYITDVGCAKRLVAQAFNSQIAGIEDENYKERVSKRIEVLKKKLVGSESEFEKRMISERIAQLEGGFAILKVGAPVVEDRKRLKDKCDDAVNAVRLALKGGTVKGAGLAFKEISDTMDNDNILKRPLTCVYDQIVNSAPEGWAIEDWVRDPYLVLKTVLEKTCAFIPTFVSINSISTEENKPKCKNCGDEE